MKSKIFISHKKEDSTTALGVANHLRINHGIETYLDVVDTALYKNGYELADHLKAEMGKCNQLIAVISYATKDSWWVPWEIGVASEKDFPLATYANRAVDVPEYLKKWPYLTSDRDLDEYARQSAAITRQRTVSRSTAGLVLENFSERETKTFYQELRRSLGQL